MSRNLHKTLKPVVKTTQRPVFDRADVLPDLPGASGHFGRAVRNPRHCSFPSEIGVRKPRHCSFPSEIGARKARHSSFPSEIGARKARHCSFPSEIAVRNVRDCSFPSARALLRLFIHFTHLDNALGQPSKPSRHSATAPPNLPDPRRRAGIRQKVAGQRQKCRAATVPLLPLTFFLLPSPLRPAPLP